MRKKRALSVRIASALLAATLIFSTGEMSVLAQEMQTDTLEQTDDGQGENGESGDQDSGEGEKPAENPDDQDQGTDGNSEGTDGGTGDSSNGDDTEDSTDGSTDDGSGENGTDEGDDSATGDENTEDGDASDEESGEETVTEESSDSEEAALTDETAETKDPNSNEVIKYGKCGDNLQYTLSVRNDKTYGLYIYGSGYMYDYEEGKAPWHSVASQITDITWSLSGSGSSSIGAYAFEGCTQIKMIANYNDSGDLYIGSEYTKIGEGAFKGCTAIKGLYIYNAEEIGNEAFADCTALKKVWINSDLGDDVTYGTGIFHNCSELNYIETGSVSPLPLEGDKWVKYGDNRDSENETKFITSIAADDYGNTIAIKKPYIVEAKLVSLDDENKVFPCTLYYDENYGELHDAEDFTKEGCTFGGWKYSSEFSFGTVTADSIVDFIDDGHVLTAIWTGDGTLSGKCGKNARYALTKGTGDSAYSYTLSITGTGDMYDYEDITPWSDYSLSKISIGEGITSIGAGDFEGTRNYNTSTITVEFPTTLTKIGDSAFSSSDIGETLDLSKTGVTEIGESAFEYCSSMKNIKFSTCLTKLDDRCFLGCYGLTGSLNLPNTVKHIGNGAFLCTEYSGKLTLPSALEYIGGNAFGETKFSGTLIIPENVSYMGQSILYGYEYDGEYEGPTIDKVEIKTDKLRTIVENTGNGTMYTGGYVFSGSKVTKIEFTNTNLEYVSNVASFSDVTEVILPEGVKYIDYAAFEGCYHLKKINLPSSIERIEDWAFYLDSSLENIELPSSLKELGKGCFSDSAIKGELKIPANVTTIRIQAFQNCTNLTVLIMPDNVSKIDSYNIINGCYPSLYFMVKKGSVTDKTLKAIGLASRIRYTTYTVTYNGNGSTGGKMNPQTVNTDATFTLSPNAFSRNGYSFMGWATSASDITPLYTDKQSVKGIATSSDGVTLYAVWKIANYSITYKNADMEDVTNPNPATYTINSGKITLKNPSRTGYTFKGWYSDSKYKKKITYIAAKSTGNKTIYAKWDVNKYTVVFNKNGGTGTVKSMTCSYGGSYSLRANKFKRKGYQFIGWGTSKSSGVVYANGQQISNLTAKNKGKITLYAQWKPIEYTYTYNLNAGSDTSATLGAGVSSTGKYTIAQKVSFVKPTRAGYTFKGWYTNAKCTKKLSYIKKGSTGNKTLYAKWAGNKYSIKFNANGGKGKMKNISGTYAYGKKLPQNKFSRAGYTFAGWSTTPGGSVEYADADVMKASLGGTASKARTTTLYAVWTPVEE